MQRKYLSETIAAVATPAGRGAMGVVRISGPAVRDIAEAILGALPKPRYAALNRFLDGDGEPIDQGLALFFPAPHSFTGEDVLELHAHGGPVVLDQLLARAIALGARQAQAGEFSERAFLNGKLDLAQAEGIADLIAADSAHAARCALRSLQGEFSNKIIYLCKSITSLRVELEAGLDFPDEELPATARTRQRERLEDARHDLDQLLAEAQQGRRLREGIVAVIAGRPNVGKSTLLNRLARRERAIVSHIPGTTRDLLHEDILIDGLAIHITDTAGLRASPDEIEQEGIRRAHEAAAQADLLLVVVDRDTPIDTEEQAAIAAIPDGCRVLIVRNKIDLTGERPSVAGKAERPEVYLSAQTGEGLDLLQAQIKTAAGYTNSEEGGFSARRRHLEALHRARSALQNAYEQMIANAPDELVAEELRLAHRALSEITGEFSSEDLLGAIFSTFCIGK